MNFCPVCGKSTEKTFCNKHEKVSLNYKDIVVRICECRRYFYRNRWLPFQSLKSVAKKIAENNIKEKTNVNPIIDEELVKKEFEIKVSYKGEKFTIPAKLQVEKCPTCSKIGTQYFESTIQLRPKDEELLDFVINIVDKNPAVFISLMEEKKEGFDLLFSSNKVAMAIGKKLKKSFKGELKTSRHIFGRDKLRSKDLWRVTVCFRRDKK